MVVNFKFKLKNKEYEIKVKECHTPVSKATGLMFKNNSPPLLFIFKNPTKTSIHSFFCSPFIAIWFLNNKIIAIKLIKPNKLSIKPEQRFDKLLEIPSNTKEFSIFLPILSTDAERFKY